MDNTTTCPMYGMFQTVLVID